MPGLPVGPIETSSCVPDGQLKQTQWRLSFKPPQPFHHHTFKVFSLSFFWHSYPWSDGVQSQCVLNVSRPSPQNCLIALTPVLGATRLPRWANPSPPLTPHLRPKAELCQPMSANFHAVAQVRFTWLGPESDPSHESDDKHDLSAIHSWLRQHLGLFKE